MLKGDKNINKHWDVSDLWCRLSEMSDKQYRYLWALIFSNEYNDINSFLEQRGVKRLSI